MRLPLVFAGPSASPVRGASLCGSKASLLIVILITTCYVCVAPRPRLHRCRSEPLQHTSVVEPATEKLHESALLGLHQWLTASGSTVAIEALVGAPLLLDQILCSYCDHLYASQAPLYMFLMAVTALQRYAPALRRQLPRAWTLATNWRLQEPVCHRSPLPVALYKALVVLAVLRGLPRFAACVCIAFNGPTRVTETLKALRSALLLPEDSLGTIRDRLYLHFATPKSARRGGARHQHASVKGAAEVAFIANVFRNIKGNEPLYPLSAATFRKRWDALLGLMLVPVGMFTPGSMRGGGAVFAYLSDVPIADLMWRMRLKNAQTLEHYLQEVTAASSLINLSVGARLRIQRLSDLYDVTLSLNPQQPV